MKEISLVLSGGGARGIAHIGVLEELEAQDFNIHSIAGTSMGAVVGAIYASGNLPSFKEWLLNLDKIDVVKLMDFTLLDKGFIKGDKVFKKLKTFLPDKNIEDLKIDFQTNATDLINKKEVLFTKGNLIDALRASTSYPNVLTPVRKEGALLVDGGVINNLPINHANRIDNDILIAVNVNANIRLKKEEKSKNNDASNQYAVQKIKEKWNKIFDINKKSKISYFNIINDSIEVMRNEMVKLKLEKIQPDILIEISRECCEVYDFYRAEQLVKTGRETAKKCLDDYFDEK